MDMRLVVEELGLNIVGAAAPAGSPMQLEVTYAVKTREGRIAVRYRGAAIDPAAVDPMSWQIVQGISTSVERRACESEGFDQEICVSFSG